MTDQKSILPKQYRKWLTLTDDYNILKTLNDSNMGGFNTFTDVITKKHLLQSLLSLDSGQHILPLILYTDFSLIARAVPED